MEEVYSVSLEDVKAYLDTKQEYDFVGMPNKGYNCLVARTIQWKYPDAMLEGGVFEGNCFADVDGEVFQIPGDVGLLADKFDAFYHDDNDQRREVTKEQLREYMPELFQ